MILPWRQNNYNRKFTRLRARVQQLEFMKNLEIRVEENDINTDMKFEETMLVRMHVPVYCTSIEYTVMHM